MKSKSLKPSILILFLWLMEMWLKAVPVDVSTTIEYINITNGLPQNTVQCIEKDKYGFMWFGTDNGLCRYDGYDFDYFNASNDIGFLWDNRILDIKADSNGFLWIVTKKGIQIFNTTTSLFEKIKDKELRELFANDIIQVTIHDGKAWVVTKDKGIFELSLGSKISEIKVLNPYWNENGVPLPSYLYSGTDGILYLGTTSGVYTFNNSKNSFIPLEFSGVDIRNIYVQTLFESGHQLWIGTTTGVCVYDTFTKEAIRYAHDPLNENTILHSNVTCIKTDAKGDVLIGTLGGVSVFNPTQNHFNKINLFPTQDINQHDVFIRSIFTDSIGNVWIGTEKTGLVHYAIYNKNFKSFPETENQFKPFNTNIINSIYHADDVLWVGTAGDGLLKYDMLKNKIEQYKFKVDDITSIESDFITSILEDKQGNVWVGTWGMGLQKRSKGGSDTFVKYHVEQGLPSNFISCIYLSKEGFLVVGTQGGLCIYNAQRDQFISVGVTNKPGDEIWEVGCVLEDREGYLWVGTTNGLYRFNTKLLMTEGTQFLSKYDIASFKETDKQNSLPNNYITCLNEDNNGYVWVGTYGNGMAKCIPQTDGIFKFENLTEKQGLANNVVYKILTDANNNLWISTENGLSQYKQDEGKFINHYSKDGLRNDQYYWSAACKAASGELYFGGMNGLNFFHPDSIKNYPFHSKTYITHLKVFNQTVKSGEKRHGLIPLKKSVFALDTIQLSYQDNVFSVEFSALPYYLSSKIKYSYQLQGVDKEWVKVSSDRRVASYTNLDGGEYLFQVKATNLDGEWNSDSARVLFIIKPPFWKTQWFKYVLLISLALLIYGYIQYRSFRVLAQKKRLEEIVKKRTIEIKEKNDQLEQSAQILMDSNKKLALRQEKIEKQKRLLENQNKEIVSQRDQLITLNKEIESIHQMRMQFFTNISHEFRTPLTLIISPLEKILNEGFSFTKENVKHTIGYIKRNAERLLLLTNEIMTFRKIEAGKVKVMLSNGNVGDYITEIAGSFRYLAAQKDIAYNLFVDSNLENTWFDKAKLENILFNLLSNAIKYSPEHGEVSLTVTKILDHNNSTRLQINVQDSGLGINPEVQGKVFDRFFRDTSNQEVSSYGTGIGLALTKEMVEVLNGTISLESEVKKGSIFKVILPLNQSDFPPHELLSVDMVEQVSLKERIQLMESRDVKEETPAVFEDSGDHDEKKYKVLVVDDNKDLRGFLAESLSVNFIIHTAVDGEEGYQLALEKDFDLVVSDIMMPKVNGLEMCKQMKNNLHTSHLPIILLTAKGQQEDYVEGLEFGADDYISKPFSLTILQAKIYSLIENRKKLIKLFRQADTDIEDADLTTTSLDEAFMDKINQVVADSYTDSTFDMEAFSSKMFVSRSLLYKKLKALTNVSPNEYVTIYRLKKSIELLKTKKNQVSEVAFMVGFNDPKYFSRVFKKFFHTLPSSYQK